MRSRLVLVTGAFGNLGRSVVAKLLSEGHRVRAFDLPSPKNRRAARALAARVELVWGDLQRVPDVERAIRNVDAVAHLAAILPPMSERKPQAARAVNIEGTRNLVRAAERVRPELPFVFASSCSVYGAGVRGLATADSFTEASDVYTETKLAAEAILRSSPLAWVILRVGAAIEASAAATDPIVMRLMFEIDPENPVELVHGKDVANAVVRAIEVQGAHRKILPIGGGPSCRLRQRELLELSLGSLGLGTLPASAFGRARYYTCWLDSEEAQRLLAFQEHDLATIERDLAVRFGRLRPLVSLLGPLVTRSLLLLSGPYRKQPARPSLRALIDAGY